jgi:peptidoglycan-associated lipoprotein
MRTTCFIIPLTVMMLATACHHAVPSGQVAPQPSDGDIALRLHIGGHPISRQAPAPVAGDAMHPNDITLGPGLNQDSINAATSARADSVEQARLVIERAARDSSSATLRKSTALQQELAGTIHFAFDRSRIESADRSALDRKAAALAANPAVRVRISGYCDARGSAGYNLALGARRAEAAKQYLVERGIAADRLDVVSFGSEHPVDVGQNEAAWARNRRAGFEVSMAPDSLSASIGAR